MHNTSLPCCRCVSSLSVDMIYTDSAPVVRSAAGDRFEALNNYQKDKEAGECVLEGRDGGEGDGLPL